MSTSMLTGAEVNKTSPANVSTTLAGLVVIANKVLRDAVVTLATVAKRRSLDDFCCAHFFSLSNLG